MQHRYAMSLLLIISLFCASAAAETLRGPNWHTLDVLYYHEGGRDTNAPKANMGGLRGTTVFRDQWLVGVETFGGELVSQTELSRSTATAFQSTVTVGYRSPASEQADLYVTAGLIRVDVDFGQFRSWQTGVLSRAGMRGVIENTWDLNAYLQYSHVNGRSATSIHTEIRYPVYGRIHVVAGAAMYARAYSGTLGLSMQF